MSFAPSVSSNGRHTVFQSYATNLVPGDTNGVADSFVQTGPPVATIQHDAAGVTFSRWVTGYSTAYSGGGYVYSRWPDASIVVEFAGTRVTWIGPKQPNYGMAVVYIDDAYVATVDCYASDADKSLEAVLWTSGGFAEGLHTLRIWPAGTRHAASTGDVVVVDRFEVQGENPSPVYARRFDDRSAVLSGPWIDQVNPTYYDRTYVYSRWTTASFVATFDGTQVAWIGPRTPFYGMADVYLNGLKVATVDQYRATQGWRELVWKSGTLLPGTYTLEIRPTGTKRPASSAANIVIDAIDVRE
jgi:hypothetical protein